MSLIMGLLGFAAIIYIVFKSDDLIKPDKDINEMTDEEKKAYKDKKTHIELFLFVLILLIAMATGIAKYM